MPCIGFINVRYAYICDYLYLDMVLVCMYKLDIHNVSKDILFDSYKHWYNRILIKFDNFMIVMWLYCACYENKCTKGYSVFAYDKACEID